MTIGQAPARILLAALLLSLGTVAPAAPLDDALRVGMPPYYEPGRLVQVNLPLLAYLESALGLPARIYTRGDYGSFAADAADYQFDLVVAVPHIARYLQQRSGYLIVAGVRDDDPFLVLTRRDDRPERLRGAGSVRVAVPDPLSLAAASLPRWSDRALPGVRIELVDSQSLRNSLQDLDGGAVDLVFMVARGLALAGPDLGDRFRVEQSGVYATYLNVFAVNPRLPEARRERLVEAIRRLPESGARERFGLGRQAVEFVPEPDLSQWDDILRRLGLGPDFATP